MTDRPALITVFGATGDLSMRKLLPALHSSLTPGGAKVLGVASSPHDDFQFHELVAAALEETGIDRAEATHWAKTTTHYQPVSHTAPYDGLRARIEELGKEEGPFAGMVIYLALPPTAIPSVVERLGAAGLNAMPGGGWVRLVVEKPFGNDLETARALNQALHQHFAEEQIYRIDHYLGKETVRNLLIFRFTNPLFEASWNRDRIERVEITVAESLGVEGRGKYYDAAGVIRDVIQSHLTQVLTLVGMEAPSTFHADAVRDEKVKVLRSIRNIPESAVVLGQYTEGTVDGEPMPAYRRAEGVAPDSTTATFAAVRVWVDNWRWQGVPFFLRTGKAMARRLTEVAVTFRRPPVCLFHSVVDDCIDTSDVLRLVLQPDEGFSLEIEVKEPGDSTLLRTVPLQFSYSELFGDIPEAYETLLNDVIEGDQTLFVRADEVEESWRLYTPLLDRHRPVHEYPAGSWGPDAARMLLPGEDMHFATGG